MAKGLRIAEPPPRRTIEAEASDPAPAAVGEKFSQIRESDRVQFNKRVPRGVADGFEMLAIRTRRKVPELLAEALGLLEDRYGRI
jgi:hypothetical protein